MAFKDILEPTVCKLVTDNHKIERVIFLRCTVLFKWELDIGKRLANLTMSLASYTYRSLKKYGVENIMTIFYKTRLSHVFCMGMRHGLSRETKREEHKQWR